MQPRQGAKRTFLEDAPISNVSRDELNQFKNDMHGRLGDVHKLVTDCHRTLSDRILHLESGTASLDHANLANQVHQHLRLINAVQGRVDAHAEELVTNKERTKRALRRTRQLRGWVEDLEEALRAEAARNDTGAGDDPDPEWLASMVERVEMVREIAQRCVDAQGCPPEHSMVARRILIWTADPEELAHYSDTEDLEQLELAADTLATAADVFEELELAHYSDPEANALNEAAWAMTHRAVWLLSDGTGNHQGAGVGPSSMELVD